MSANAMRILLVGADASDAHSVSEALADVPDASFIVEWAPRLVEAVDRLRASGIAAVLLDVGLPDGEGIAAFDEDLVIGSPDDAELATRAIKGRTTGSSIGK